MFEDWIDPLLVEDWIDPLSLSIFNVFVCALFFSGLESREILNFSGRKLKKLANQRNLKRIRPEKFKISLDSANALEKC